MKPKVAKKCTNPACDHPLIDHDQDGCNALVWEGDLGDYRHSCMCPLNEKGENIDRVDY